MKKLNSFFLLFLCPLMVFGQTGNTGYGTNALYSNTTGTYNSAYGSHALYSNIGGYSNTANGYYALYSNTGSNNYPSISTGYENTATGAYALYSNNTGRINTATGAYALYANTTGSLNTANGALVLYANTTGGGNTANGYYALRNNTTGNNNTANGLYALASNKTGSYNTASGYYAHYLGSGNSYNTAYGSYALYNNSEGNSNTANGYYTLGLNRSGSYNVATGYYALYSNTNGNNNTATGHYALYYNTTGSFNTAYGFYALQNNTTGTHNTACGPGTLVTNSTGSYNTAIGSYAGNASISNATNATVIGSDARYTASNQVRIGNSSVTSIGGYSNWTNVSDGRVKKNIRAEVPGLDFINLLQPVTYNLDLNAIDKIMKSDDPEINRLTDSLRLARSSEETEILVKAKANKENQVYSGFIAQDVEKAAQSVGYNFSGVDAPLHDKSTYGLRYADFVVPLVKAVQELSEQNTKLQEQVNELAAKLDELTKSQNAGVIEKNQTAKDFSFTLFPNPTNGFVTVNYTLYVDTSISIEIYSTMGQKLKTILSNQYKTMGDYSVQASVSDLITGTYIVKATSKSQIESLQLVVKN